MRALVAERAGERARVAERDDPAGDGVLIEATFSSVNYKDAMAVAGRPGVLRSTPMVPGIDVVGTADGREVVVTGSGLGERRDGGLAQRVLADPEAVVPVPEAFGARRAAAIACSALPTKFSTTCCSSVATAMTGRVERSSRHSSMSSDSRRR